MAPRDLVRDGGHVVEWPEYARVVDRCDWQHFGCRGAQLVIADHGAFVECPVSGPEPTHTTRDAFTSV